MSVAENAITSRNEAVAYFAGCLHEGKMSPEEFLIVINDLDAKCRDFVAQAGQAKVKAAKAKSTELWQQRKEA